MEDKQILQQIQPNCDAIYKRLKSAAADAHKTHRDIEAATGIPRHTIAKLFTGRIANPGVSDIAALCILFGLSMDDLVGVSPPPPPASASELELAELRGRLSTAEAEVSLLKERSKILEQGIAERKPLIYGLAGLCIFLSLAFVAYLTLDVADTSHGFVRGSVVSPSLALLILAIVVTALGTLHTVAARRAKKRR